jgi:hypothetical protein
MKKKTLNKRRFYLYLILFTLFNCSNQPSYLDEELDKYINMTFFQVVELLGSPDIIYEPTIDNNVAVTPGQPIFSAYFSQEELETGVVIRIAKWILDKGKTERSIWFKNKDDEWIVFRSWKIPIRKGVEY